MKKSIYIISILAAGLLLMVYSCSKEEVAIEKNSRKFEITDAKESYNRIISFRNVVSDYRENPMYKSTELIDIDEMLWNLNATVNYEYSFVDDPYRHFFNQNVYYNIAVQEENMVILGDVLQVYLDQEDDLAEALSLAPFTNKAIQFVFIRIDSIENQTVYLNSKISVGEKGTDGTGPFGADDDWKYGKNLGDCYGNYLLDRDAADEIRDMVEYRRPIYIKDEGLAVFYVNPTLIILNKDDIDYNPLMDLTNGQGYDNIRDYRIFYVHPDHNNPPGGSITQFDCIEDYDMNFYTAQMEYLIYTLMPSNQSYWPGIYNKTFVKFDTIVGNAVKDENDEEYYIHLPEIIFAYRMIMEI